MTINKRLFIMLACCICTIFIFQGMKLEAATTSPFKDVSDKHWARGAIQWGYEQGIVQGDQNNRFTPDSKVTEAEFLAMISRAYKNDLTIRAVDKGEKWYRPYFDLATDQQWFIYGYNVTTQRYHVANLIYSMVQGGYVGDEASIQFLLDTGLSSGKTSATVAGYLPYDHLTRAEAVVFIQRLKRELPTLKQGQVNNVSKGLRNISIGDSEEDLIKRLGQPNRKDATSYSFTWYVYNKTPHDFAMYGIQNKKVVALYSNARHPWGEDQTIKVGSSLYALKKHIGASNVQASSDVIKHESNGVITFYYLDKFAEYAVDSMLIIKEEDSKAGNAAESTVESAYNRQIFDFTNVFRFKHALRSQLTWSEHAAKAAYSHSKDMHDKSYMDHTNSRGETAEDRMKAAGLTNFGGGENIAYGYEDSFEVYNGWLNSNGHRENMLFEHYKLLGVGTYRSYYTQNFVMPY